MIPAFCWMLLGTQLLGPMLVVWRRRVFQVALCGWLLFGFLFVGEWRSLLRSFLPLPAIPEQVVRLRVVSVNAGSGKELTLQCLKSLKPDLLLVQESPAAYLLPDLTQELWDGPSGYAAGVDCTILGRGAIEKREWVRIDAMYQQAVWKPQPGLEIDVFSLRLSSVPIDVTFWDEQARRTYREVREQHRRELAPLLKRLENLREDQPMIVGGDFNCPAGDRTEWPLRQWLSDAFRVQGRGWGNTITRRMPVHRIDRIWVSKQLVPINVTAHRTQHSDHWCVVCDLYILPENFQAAQLPQAAARINSPPQ
jgi:hypothetical protein